MPRTSDALIEAMADEIKKDIQRMTRRVIRCSSDPEVRARLLAASSSYLFGIACASQSNLSPQHTALMIAESMAADHVDAIAKPLDGLFYPK